ncbi:MAG: PAS domain-containing protein, partial [Chloroflexota bacterium]|nr:PAS domain-containing protein [Chloroflexota bacterium]
MQPSLPASQATPPPRDDVGWLETAARLSGGLWWMTNREGLVAGARELSAFTGLPEAALTGAGWLAAVAPSDRAALAVRWQAAQAARKPLVTACRFLRPDGEHTWLSARCAPLGPTVAGAEPRWLWLATQTAQERAIGALSYYRALFRQQGQGVALIDGQGTPLRVNAAALELLGLQLEQARGAATPPTGWRILGEDGAEVAQPFAELASATASGEATHAYWQVNAEGWPASHWLSVTASPVIRSQARTRARSLIILTDVTEETLQRIATQTRAQRTGAELASLRAALDRMTDAFIALDYTGRFTYLNTRAREQFEPADTPLLGKRFWEIFPSLAGSALEMEYRRILRERTPSMVEVMFGEDSWYEFRAYPASDGVSVYIRDITAQKRTMAELDAALARERVAHERAEGRAQELDAIFEAVGDAMLFFAPDGSVLRANQAMRDLVAALGRKIELPISAERVLA